MGNKTMEKLLFLVVVLDFFFLFFYLSTCAYTVCMYIHTYRKVFFSHCNETKDHRISRNKSYFFFFLDNVSSVISVYSRNLVFNWILLHSLHLYLSSKSKMHKYILVVYVCIYIYIYISMYSSLQKFLNTIHASIHTYICMYKYVNNYN